MPSLIALELANIPEGADITITEESGVRKSGSVVRKRPDVDPDNCIGIRRSTATVDWIPYARVRSVERLN